MVSNRFQKVPDFYLEGTEYEKVHWAFIQLTLFVKYNDGLCSLPYTTNLLKDGCLASIGPSYDKNAKVGTFVLLPEDCDILFMSGCKEPVKFVYRWDNILTHWMQVHSWLVKWKVVCEDLFPAGCWQDKRLKCRISGSRDGKLCLTVEGTKEAMRVRPQAREMKAGEQEWCE